FQSSIPRGIYSPPPGNGLLPQPVGNLWKSERVNDGPLEHDSHAPGRQARRERAENLVRADAPGLLRRRPGLPGADRFGPERRFCGMDLVAAWRPPRRRRRAIGLSGPRDRLRAAPRPRVPRAGPLFAASGRSGHGLAGARLEPSLYLRYFRRRPLQPVRARGGPRRRRVSLALLQPAL